MEDVGGTGEVGREVREVRESHSFGDGSAGLDKEETRQKVRERRRETRSGRRLEAHSSQRGQTRPIQADEGESALPEKMSFEAVRAMVETVEG